ncbi:MAG: hypothetical protein ACYDFS_10660 [Vulcanimicrobiaceae bacterium]
MTWTVLVMVVDETVAQFPETLTWYGGCVEYTEAVAVSVADWPSD